MWIKVKQRSTSLIQALLTLHKDKRRLWGVRSGTDALPLLLALWWISLFMTKVKQIISIIRIV